MEGRVGTVVSESQLPTIMEKQQPHLINLQRHSSIFQQIGNQGGKESQFQRSEE